MKKTTIAILALLTFFTTAFAQEHKERTAPSVRPLPTATPRQTETSPAISLEGLRYTSPEGRYTVLLPKQPDLSTQQITTPDGSPVTQYLAMAGDDKSMMMIAYFDYPPGIVFNLDKARDGMVNSIKGTLLEEHSMSLGGAPGRQITVVARTEQGMEFIDRARFYDLNPRIFVLQCLVPKSLDNAAAAERCEQFFDSFRVRTTQ